MREYMKTYVKERKLRDPEFAKQKNIIHARYMKKRCDADADYHESLKQYHKNRYNNFKDAIEKLNLNQSNLGK